MGRQLSGALRCDPTHTTPNNGRTKFKTPQLSYRCNGVHNYHLSRRVPSLGWLGYYSLLVARMALGFRASKEAASGVKPSNLIGFEPMV